MESIVNEKYGDITKLLKRLRVSLIIGVLFITLYYCFAVYFSTIEVEKNGIESKLKAITSTLSESIDGDVHERLFNKYPLKDDIKTNNQDSDYEKIHKKLATVYSINNLKTSIYTLVLEYSGELNKPSFRFGVTSSETPYFKHTYRLYPEELLKNYYTGGLLSNYEDENGSWISSWTPILNTEGNVVCVVQADYPFDEFIVPAQKKLLKKILISLLPVLFIYYLLHKAFSSLINRENVISELNTLIKSKTELVKETEKAKRTVETHMRLKEQFLANMSHEIRTPLNGIEGMTQILEKTKLSKDQKECLSILRTSADNLLVIVNDILDISKIEAGKLKVEKIGFNLRNNLEKILKTLSYKAEEKGILLELDADEKIPEVLIGDPTRMDQIIINLVNNAIKFTEKGSVKLKCKVKEEREEKIALKFEVIDTGVGIESEKLEDIFSNFSQEDDSTTREYGGTGLGLAISRQLVELFKGKLEVESTKGEGSKFYFTIKFPVGTKDDLLIKKSPILFPESLNGKKVLLAEDNQINQFLAVTLLEKWKMVVDVAENGQIAVEKLRQQKYDVVLMDMQMPVMGGIEATIIIRKELKLSVPIIALTANAIKGVDKECLDAGMDDYIAKPFDHSDLFNKILNAINYGRTTV